MNRKEPTLDQFVESLREHLGELRASGKIIPGYVFFSHDDYAKLAAQAADRATFKVITFCSPVRRTVRGFKVTVDGHSLWVVPNPEAS